MQVLVVGLTGSAAPRLWTPPLRKLTRSSSRGFEVVERAEAWGVSLMPWQRWLLVHALELRAKRDGGGYRFRVLLVVVARQSGKTTIGKLVALDRMQTAGSTVLGTSTNLEYARDAFAATVELATDAIPDDVEKVKWGSLNTSLELSNRSRYRVASASRRGGRSLSVDLAILDELREHTSWDAWGAASGATTARPDWQIWALSNAGTDESVVLNHQRESALAFIESGVGDDSMGLFEWSGPDDCELDDRAAWCQANPALGHTITEATLVSKLATSPPAVFRTEHLCQRVASLDSAVDLAAWRDCSDHATTLEGLRDKVALCVDVSLDMTHVTLVAAAVGDDGRVRVEVVEAWDSVQEARKALPGWLKRIRPRCLRWFPKGPAAALAADLRGVRNAEPIKADEVSEACLGLTEQVSARRVLHQGDPLIAHQLQGTQKVWLGDGWRFSRRGAIGHADAVYALAGAVHAARTLPPALPALVVA